MKNYLFLALLGLLSMTSCCAYSPDTSNAITLSLEEDVGNDFITDLTIKSGAEWTEATTFEISDNFNYYYNYNLFIGESSKIIVANKEKPKNAVSKYFVQPINNWQERPTIRADGFQELNSN